MARVFRTTKALTKSLQATAAAPFVFDGVGDSLLPDSVVARFPAAVPELCRSNSIQLAFMKEVIHAAKGACGQARRFFFQILVTSVLLLSDLSAVETVGAQIDQENWDVTPPTVSFSVVQQEFTPTLDTLDSVQLLFAFVPVTWPGGALSVNIRQGGTDGPVITASKPTYVTPSYVGTVGFAFAKPVSVVPGQVYALEPFNNIAGAPFGVTPPRYSGGRFYCNFQVADYDLMFREGIGLATVPEPPPAVLFFGAELIFILGALRLRSRCCVTQNA